MTELQKLVDKYGVKKAELDILKKDADELNKQIKTYMSASEMTSVETNSFVAKYQKRVSESLDEDSVIEILKENHIRGIIKTKEYVDEEALENAIYAGKIDATVLKEINKCKNTKTTYALLIEKKR